MSAEFWGALIGGVALTMLVNVATVAYFFGKTVERIEGLEKLMTSEVEAIKGRVDRVEQFIDNRRTFAASGRQ